MEKMKNIKTPLVVFVTISLLIFMRWAFNYLELGAPDNTACTLAEMGVFAAIYTVSFLRKSPILVGVFTLVGCGFLVFMYRYTSVVGGSQPYLLPLTYIPVFLFYVHQLTLAQMNHSAFRVLWSLLTFGYPIVYAILIVYIILAKNESVSGEILFEIVLFVALAAFYMHVLYTPLKLTPSAGKQRKKEKQSQKNTLVMAQYSFGTAVLNMALALVFFLLQENTALMLTVFILWVVDIIFLYERESPFITGKLSSTQQKISHFLKGK